MMKKIAIFLFCLPLLFAATASIVDSTGTTTNVESSAAFKVYVDTFGNNPDFALELCNAGQKYAGAVYSANVSGTFVMVPISKNLTSGSTNTLVYTSLGAGPCYTTPVDSFAFSQFRDFTRTPPIFVSAFPGRIHVLYSNNADGTGSPDLVPLNYSDGWLVGAYDLTPIPYFTQATGDVTVNVNSITFQTELGAIERSPSDSQWGLNSSTGRSMLLALCSDDIGNQCDDAVVVNSTSDLPAGLSVVGTINDQNVHHRYVVVDGLGEYICVGANLRTTVTPVPSSILYGGNSTVTITVTNTGNVGITTDFILQYNVSGSGYSDTINYTITEDLAANGGFTTRQYVFNATGQAGTVNLRAYADSTDVIAECSEADNLGTATISISPVWYLHVWIDGNYTNEFPEWGRPYNVTFYINNSNGDEVPNARYEIIETNGLNPFVPIQVWNDGTDKGLSSASVGTATGDSSGYLTVALIPTCNKFYAPGSPIDLTPILGDYTIVVRGYNGATQLSFAYNGSTVSNYPLLVPNRNCVDPGWVNDKEIINKDSYVFDIYDWMYEVYSITKKLVVP